MRVAPHWKLALAACLAAALCACGGGGGSSTPAAPAPVIVPTGPGAPTATGNAATDAYNWINYRRAQLGVPTLTRNSQIDQAAQAHSTYQRLNGTVTHTETAGNPGFTGVTLRERLAAAGYVFNQFDAYAYGEVISASGSNNGFYMAEELITAIYHRFVMFEPKFKEVGTGEDSNASGYGYLTCDFTANNGYGIGLGRGAVASWPYDGQTGVPANFLSDYESPDPVPDANEVGYPISVHADINLALSVSRFTVRERGAAADLATKLLVHASDADTPPSAAAIIPLAVLKSGTTYDVSFSGSLSGVNVAKNWSFTTK